MQRLDSKPNPNELATDCLYDTLGEEGSASSALCVNGVLNFRTMRRREHVDITFGVDIYLTDVCKCNLTSFLQAKQRRQDVAVATNN